MRRQRVPAMAALLATTWDLMVAYWRARQKGQGWMTRPRPGGTFVRKQIGIGDKPRNIPLRLPNGIRALLPQHAGLLDKHHDAGVDSVMHWLLARDLISRAKSA